MVSNTFGPFFGTVVRVTATRCWLAWDRGGTSRFDYGVVVALIESGMWVPLSWKRAH